MRWAKNPTGTGSFLAMRRSPENVDGLPHRGILYKRGVHTCTRDIVNSLALDGAAQRENRKGRGYKRDIFAELLPQAKGAARAKYLWRAMLYSEKEVKGLAHALQAKQGEVVGGSWHGW